ncbi:MAG: mannosyltransferase family protein [Actinomycetota bacterium]
MTTEIRDTAQTSRSSTGRRRLRDRIPPDLEVALLYCLKIFLLVRVGLALLAIVGVTLLPPNEAAGVPGWPAPELTPGWHNLFTSWERWDALWFLRIASSGYDATDGSAAFFPLYPMIVRGVSFGLGGHPLAAALIVSNVAYLGAMVTVYRLTEYEFDTERARNTILFMSIFPTALFFFAPYSESLFLLLAAGSIYAARRDRWITAGLLGALAALTRSVGLVLIVVLAAEALRRWMKREGREPVRLIAMLACAAAVAVGTLSYLVFWNAFDGNWLAPIGEQGNWQRTFAVIPYTLWAGTREAWRYVGQFPGGYHTIDWLVVVPVLLLATWVAFRTPLPYAVYTVASLLLPLSLIFESRPLMSVPRFAVVLFPIYWAMDHFAKRWRSRSTFVGVSAAGLGILTVLFVNWYWIF